MVKKGFRMSFELAQLSHFEGKRDYSRVMEVSRWVYMDLLDLSNTWTCSLF